MSQTADTRILRTPDERFDGLPNFPWAPRYLEAKSAGCSVRIHYVDTGVRGDEVFLCLHGQPTWSYLYRRMIRALSTRGRVIAPDLAGFGRSDKPADERVYSFDFHRSVLLQLIDGLNLERLTLIVQDWGGLIGLTLPMDAPHRYRRLVIMNTMIGGGDRLLPEGFLKWRDYNRSRPDLDVASLMRRACPHLSEEEAEAYAAPFPDSRYKAGVRRFPELVPDHPEAPGAALSRRARNFLKDGWQGPVFVAVGERDVVFTPQHMHDLCREIGHPGTDFLIPEAGHFPQEWGEPLSERILGWMAQTS